MKPGAFTQIHIHLVFAVKHRECLLHGSVRETVFKYLSGIVTGLKHKSIIVNGFSDHVHVFIGLNPSVSISDTVHALKRNSSLFINEKKLFAGTFSWQEGYGAFSCSKGNVERVYQYILNQESHHQKRSFQEEYLEFLRDHDIKYDDRYLFRFFDNATPTG